MALCTVDCTRLEHVGPISRSSIFTVENGKDAGASKLGRLGGLKGGEARATKLTPQQRSEIANIAANARWEN